MLGVAISGQVADAVLVTGAAVQLSLPVAVTVLLTEQPSVDAVKLAVKLTVAPGASVIGPMTGVLGTGWLFRTTMLFNVTLPVLLTLPEKVSNPPGETGCAEHTLVTVMPGVFIPVQVADAVFVTMTFVQLSLPVAITVLLTEQASMGAVKLAPKVADAPGTKLGTVNTVPDWLLTTVTLFKVMLPVFRTVPL